MDIHEPPGQVTDHHADGQHSSNIPHDLRPGASPGR